MYKFLENEKQSNLELLEVRQTSFDHDFEIQCQQAFGKFIRYYSPDNNQIDPAVIRFLYLFKYLSELIFNMHCIFYF